MLSNPLLPPLGRDLLAARRALGMTQPALAAAAGCSVPTLRLAERGGGGLETFAAAAGAVQRIIGGRGLPPGPSTGARLAALRARQRMGTRPVAALAGVSASSLATLERGGDCHLRTAVSVASALGVILRLATGDEGFWAGVGTASVHHGWTTPPWLLGVLHEVVGGRFGLDVCSPTRSGPVAARIRFTEQDDALTRPWRAPTVFMNPPYGRTLGLWVAKARAEHAEGRASLVVGLVPARTDTRWWHASIAGHADVWMLKGRLAFGDGSASAPFPSALTLWGATDGHRAALTAALPDAWHVPLAIGRDPGQ